MKKLVDIKDLDNLDSKGLVGVIQESLVGRTSIWAENSTHLDRSFWLMFGLGLISFCATIVWKYKFDGLQAYNIGVIFLSLIVFYLAMVPLGAWAWREKERKSIVRQIASSCRPTLKEAGEFLDAWLTDLEARNIGPKSRFAKAVANNQAVLASCRESLIGLANHQAETGIDMTQSAESLRAKVAELERAIAEQGEFEAKFKVAIKLSRDKAKALAGSVADYVTALDRNRRTEALVEEVCNLTGMVDDAISETRRAICECEASLREAYSQFHAAMEDAAFGPTAIKHMSTVLMQGQPDAGLAAADVAIKSRVANFAPSDD